MAVVSALIVFTSVASFIVLYSSANRGTAVLVVARPMEKGQRFVSGDLEQATASISGQITPIPVADASELVGKHAAVAIPAGSLLTSGDVSGGEEIAPGDAVVGLALKDGQLPSGGLAAGDQVMIVQTASPGTPLSSGAEGSSGDAEAESGVLVPAATVFDSGLPSGSAASGDAQLVSVEVASTEAAAVSTAAAAGQVSLVLLPAGPTVQSSGSTGEDDGGLSGTSGGVTP